MASGVVSIFANEAIEKLDELVYISASTGNISISDNGDISVNSNAHGNFSRKGARALQSGDEFAIAAFTFDENGNLIELPIENGVIEYGEEVVFDEDNDTDNITNGRYRASQ